MIPNSGIPNFTELGLSNALFDLLRCNKTPDAFFRALADGELSNMESRALDRFLFGFFLFDIRKNHQLWELLDRTFFSLSQATGNNTILWTPLSDRFDMVSCIPTNDLEYELWGRESESLNTVFQSICFNVLGIKNNGRPVIVLPDSLRARRILVLELTEEFERMGSLRELFMRLSETAGGMHGHKRCQRREMLQQFAEGMGIPCYAKSVKGGVSFAAAMEKVYSLFLQNSVFRERLRDYVDEMNLDEAARNAEQRMREIQDDMCCYIDVMRRLK